MEGMAAVTPERVDARPVSDRFVDAFVRLWAFAAIVHLVIQNDGRFDSPWNVTTVLAAFVVLVRPRSVGWFAVMAAAQLADLVAELPASPDHWMVIGFVDLAFLVALLVHRGQGSRALATAFPAVRVIVLVAYSAAALAKWNTTFLDAPLSCATAIAERASFGAATGLGLDPVYAYAVLATEAAIPALLLFRRTRRHGVRVGLAFHFVLSASPAFAVVDFTALLYAAFFLFLSDDDADRLLDRLAAISSRSAVVRDVRRFRVPVTVAAFLFFAFAGYVATGVHGAVAFVLIELVLAAVLLAGLLSWRGPAAARRFGSVSWWLVPVILLTAAWVASPYLGGRTTGVLTMFSGLRTEAGVENHLFLPTAHLTDWQEDLVTLRRSNDETLDRAAEQEVAVPLMALRRLATDDPDLVVEGVLDGEEVSFGPGPDQVHLVPLPYWQYKLLLFRPVGVGDVPFCSIS